MRVLTAQQMREADRLTVERGWAGVDRAERLAVEAAAAGAGPGAGASTPGLDMGAVLMERAGARVVELIEREFAPLGRQRVVIFCGKGKNGGDGLVVGRRLAGRVEALQVVLVTDALGKPLDRDATVVVDALLGTGFRGPVEGRYAELIRSMNEDFPKARIVAVDLPSAMQVRADYTVTFAAPKAEMLMSPDAANIGKLVVADIGIPEEFLASDLAMSEPGDFRALFAPRRADAHKGDFGHVLVVGGAPGKTGAAAMSGLAALRSGAGLATVACASDARLAPELMWNPLDGIELEKKTVLAIGPGLGHQPELVARLLKDVAIPVVLDADGLNSIAGANFRGRGVATVMTPHPGEMARLTGRRVEDRLETARAFAREHNVCLVLKGYRTLVAFPDGRVWINPTGSPAMAKGGSGDILTGMIAGLIAQHPGDIPAAVRAAVWLHGRAGELAAEDLTDTGVLATDLLRYLPGAIRECAPPDPARHPGGGAAAQ